MTSHKGQMEEGEMSQQPEPSPSMFIWICQGVGSLVVPVDKRTSQEPCYGVTECQEGDSALRTMGYT